MQSKPTIRREPVGRHRYGRDIATRGSWIWAAYDNDRLICIGATKAEARKMYRAERAKVAHANNMATLYEQIARGDGTVG